MGLPVFLSKGGPQARTLAPYSALTSQAFEAKMEKNHGRLPYGDINWKATVPILFGVYLAASFIVLFFNVAFLASVRKILNGQQTTFKEGLAMAWMRRKNIFQWSLFSATIGVILKILEGWTDNWLVRKIIGAGQISLGIGVVFGSAGDCGLGRGPDRGFAEILEFVSEDLGRGVVGGLGPLCHYGSCLVIGGRIAGCSHDNLAVS